MRSRHSAINRTTAATSATMHIACRWTNLEGLGPCILRLTSRFRDWAFAPNIASDGQRHELGVKLIQPFPHSPLGRNLDSEQ